MDLKTYCRTIKDLLEQYIKTNANTNAKKLSNSIIFSIGEIIELIEKYDKENSSTDITRIKDKLSVVLDQIMVLNSLNENKKAKSSPILESVYELSSKLIVDSIMIVSESNKKKKTIAQIK